MQGESDTVANRSSRYEESLKGLLDMLAEDLKREDIHLVLGRLSDVHADDPALLRKALCSSVNAWRMLPSP